MSKINPKHYQDLTPEPTDVIEGWQLSWHLGNAVKYIARAGRKNGETRTEDLLKAANFLHRAATGRWMDPPPPAENDQASTQNIKKNEGATVCRNSPVLVGRPVRPTRKRPIKTNL